MEKGDMRVPLHFIARSLHVFGELDRLATLLDSANDEIGLTLADWKAVATSPGVGLTAREAKDFAPAFEHAQRDAALALLR